MLKTNLKAKHPQYTYLKGSIYYYSRAVPKDVSGHYSTKRIVLSLRTRSLTQARIISRAFSNSLEQYWLSLRLQQISIPASTKVKQCMSSAESPYPLISESKDLYLSVKGKGRSRLFFDSTNRNINYLINCLGNNHLNYLTSKDAAKFRDWLSSKGLASSSIQRIFSGVKAVISFVILEQGLECSNPFTRVYIPNNLATQKRHAISKDNILKIQNECIQVNDDIRWLVALISYTGMRLSEAVGLKIDDLVIDTEIPYVRVQPHPHRRLKTAGSQRVIPLIGAALWAANQILLSNINDYCFPRYASQDRCSSNSASASLNKWIKTITSNKDVIHGFRHSFRDRLRDIEAPIDLIDRLGGWSIKSVGQGYGDGYTIDILQKHMLKIENSLTVFARVKD
jgi:integrase